MPKALITGITGQDGRYLAEFLRGRGYDIAGLVTGQNNPRSAVITEELPFVELVGRNLQDFSSPFSARRLSPWHGRRGRAAGDRCLRRRRGFPSEESRQARRTDAERAGNRGRKP